MKRVFALAVLGTVLVALTAAQAPPNPANSKTAKPSKTVKPAAKTAKGKVAPHLRAAAGTRRVVTRRKINGRWVKVTRLVPAPPSYQLHPDAERYTEIQKALLDRGYFKGEPNGQWNDDSVDALKRFQTDQNLTADGKISSLTLIGLGLGPHHETAAVTVPAPPAPAPIPATNPETGKPQ